MVLFSNDKHKLGKVATLLGECRKNVGKKLFITVHVYPLPSFY